MTNKASTAVETVLQNINTGLGSPQPCDAKRLFHGRGQCFEGLEFINIDYFDPLLLITLYSEPQPAFWEQFVEQLSTLPSRPACVLVQHRYQRSAMLETLWGTVPDITVAREQGLEFLLDFSGKQNIGFFLDMSPGRQWLRAHCEGKRVLNLFSFTCAFSVVAIAASAHSVMNVDMSKAALAVGRENHRRNEQSKRLQRDIQFLAHNLFRSWKRVTQSGPYDIVIIDPPSHQAGSFIASKDYAKVIRRLPALLPKGGEILACLNSPQLDEQFLLDQFKQECPSATFKQRLKNRSDFPEQNSDRNLKMLHFVL